MASHLAFILLHASGNFSRDRFTMLAQSLLLVQSIGELPQLQFPQFATSVLETVLIFKTIVLGLSF